MKDSDLIFDIWLLTVFKPHPCLLPLYIQTRWHKSLGAFSLGTKRKFMPLKKPLSPRDWQPTPGYLPGETHGQRSQEGYSPRVLKESDTTEQLTLSLSCHFSHHRNPQARLSSCFLKPVCFLAHVGCPLLQMSYKPFTPCWCVDGTISLNIQTKFLQGRHLIPWVAMQNHLNI